MADSSTNVEHAQQGISIPQLSSDDLNIASWEPMDRGGHSFVFKVSIDGETSVIKIFRLHAFFARESASYRRLAAAQLTGTLTPRVYGTLRISPTHEAYLLSSKKLDSQVRRSLQSGQCLMAVWIEYIPGRRLALSDILGDPGSEVRRRVEAALERVHGAGVLQGDVKWRNIMVVKTATTTAAGVEVSETRRVVWLDFSNADTVEGAVGGGAGGGGGQEEGGYWEVKVEEEMERVREMLAVYELTSPTAFEFEAVRAS